jgi:cytochrome P450
VGWGRRIDRKNDYVAQQALKLMGGVDLVILGLYLMEAIPVMIRFPSFLYSLPKKLRIGSAIGARYFYMLTEEGARSAFDCFAKTMTKAQKQQKMTDVEVAGLMANLIGGGVDTTSSTMLSCILAMACFPDVQAKAQIEIDDIVGQDRSPT